MQNLSACGRIRTHGVLLVRNELIKMSSIRGLRENRSFEEPLGASLLESIDESVQRGVEPRLAPQSASKITDNATPHAL